MRKLLASMQLRKCDEAVYPHASAGAHQMTRDPCSSKSRRLQQALSLLRICIHLVIVYLPALHRHRDRVPHPAGASAAAHDHVPAHSGCAVCCAVLCCALCCARSTFQPACGCSACGRHVVALAPRPITARPCALQPATRRPWSLWCGTRAMCRTWPATSSRSICAW